MSIYQPKQQSPYDNEVDQAKSMRIPSFTSRFNDSLPRAQQNTENIEPWPNPPQTNIDPSQNLPTVHNRHQNEPEKQYTQSNTPSTTRWQEHRTTNYRNNSAGQYSSNIAGADFPSFAPQLASDTLVEGYPSYSSPSFDRYHHYTGNGGQLQDAPRSMPYSIPSRPNTFNYTNPTHNKTLSLGRGDTSYELASESRFERSPNTPNLPAASFQGLSAVENNWTNLSEPDRRRSMQPPQNTIGVNRGPSTPVTSNFFDASFLPSPPRTNSNVVDPFLAYRRPIAMPMSMTPDGRAEHIDGSRDSIDNGYERNYEERNYEERNYEERNYREIPNFIRTTVGPSSDLEFVAHQDEPVSATSTSSISWEYRSQAPFNGNPNSPTSPIFSSSPSLVAQTSSAMKENLTVANHSGAAEAAALATLTNSKPRKNKLGGKGPERLKRPPNAFLIFNQMIRGSVVKDYPTQSASETSKMISAMWKGLSENERMDYKQQAENLTKEIKSKHDNYVYMRRSKAELGKADNGLKKTTGKRKHREDDFLPSSSDSSKRTGQDPRGRKKKKESNPNAPKHTMSAFLFFNADKRPELTSKGSKMGLRDGSKILSSMWRNLSPEGRAYYEKKAEEDKMRYRREKEQHDLNRTDTAMEEEEEEEEEEDDDNGEPDNETIEAVKHLINGNGGRKALAPKGDEATDHQVPVTPPPL